MTVEESIEFGNMWLQINEDCKDSNTYAFFQMAIKALKQEPTEWQKDHEILKAYSDGANEVLDSIRAEIEGYRSTIDKAISEDELKIEGMKEAYTDVLGIINKYKEERTG